MAALDTLVNPPFANDPPVKLNLDAKVVGLVVAILAGISALLGFFALIGLLGIGAVLAAFGGIFVLALLGLIAGLVANVMAVIGGWQMYQGNESGKRLVIYGLAIAFVAEIVLAIGYSVGSAILQLILLAVLYYAVVVSRYPGQADSAGPSRGL
jgi:amino acid transporter